MLSNSKQLIQKVWTSGEMFQLRTKFANLLENDRTLVMRDKVIMHDRIIVQITLFPKVSEQT